MREKIFRVEYCDEGKCIIPENQSCFSIKRYGIRLCTKAKAQEITENWICNECNKKFDKFDKKHQIVVPPVIPKGTKTVKTYILIKTICDNCYIKLGKPLEFR